MKTFKKIVPIVFLVALFIPLISLAQSQSIEIPNPLGKDSTIWTVTGKIIDFIFWIATVAGVFVIIYAGYKFLFSAGDPEKVKNARYIIIYTLIGLIVVWLSKGIINLLLTILGSESRIP